MTTENLRQDNIEMECDHSVSGRMLWSHSEYVNNTVYNKL
jgi:hypothetical protein